MSGVAGKALSGQLDPAAVIAVAAGALLGSCAGAYASRRVPARTLRITLACVLSLTSVKMAGPVVGL